MKAQSVRFLWRSLLTVIYLMGILGIIASGGNGDDDEGPARSFGVPELLETNPGDARQPKIATDSTGNALVVWAQDNGTSYDIWANRYLAGGGWGTAELIENETGDASSQRLVMDVMGNGMATWLQDNGTDVNLWSARYEMGTGWGAPELVENEPGDASSPAIATGPLGNVIAVWSQNNGVRDSIRANFYSPGTGWSTPVMIESGSVDAINPQVAMDPEGNSIVVWIRDEGENKSLWSKYYSPVTGWEATEHMIASSEDPLVAIMKEPRIRMDLVGNGMVIWTTEIDSWLSIGVFASRYVQASGWETWTRISTADGVYASEPDIAMDSTGNVWAVWESLRRGFQGIKSNFYSVGTGWLESSETIRVKEVTDGTPIFTSPKVVMFDSGEALCVYVTDRGSIGYSVYEYLFQYEDWGWSWTEIIDDGSDPDLAKDIAGNAIVVYEDYDGVYTNIMASRYE